MILAYYDVRLALLHDLDDKILELAKHSGFGLELLFHRADIASQLSKQDLITIRDSLTMTTNRISLHAPIHNLDLGSQDEVINSYSFAAYNRIIEIAGFLNADKVVVHTGFNPNIGPIWKDYWLHKFLEQLEALLIVARQHNVILLLENTWEQDWELFELVFKQLNVESLAMVFDTAHAELFSKHKPVEWLQHFKDKILHIHLVDTEGIYDNHGALGQGILDWKTIFHYIDLLPTRPTLVLEMDLKDIKLSLDFLNRKLDNV
jgi:sugar phosphate isomerase/epimerase